ncbi:MAG: hypothetical protein KTR14_01575 [Vampirovibrio sp.]|nr:hypothetical protein [Vampirovibrio sp.]
MSSYNPTSFGAAEPEVTVRDFSAFRQKSGGNIITQASEFLVKSAEWHLRKYNAEAVLIPSINDLSPFFRCSQMDILNILLSLRIHGYDYEFATLDSSIRVWQAKEPEKPANSQQQRNQRNNQQRPKKKA